MTTSDLNPRHWFAPASPAFRVGLANGAAADFLASGSTFRALMALPYAPGLGRRAGAGQAAGFLLQLTAIAGALLLVVRDHPLAFAVAVLPAAGILAANIYAVRVLPHLERAQANATRRSPLMDGPCLDRMPDHPVDLPGRTTPVRAFARRHLRHANPRAHDEPGMLARDLYIQAAQTSARAPAAAMTALAETLETDAAPDAETLAWLIRQGHLSGLAGGAASAEADLLWAAAACGLDRLGVEHLNDASSTPREAGR